MYGSSLGKIDFRKLINIFNKLKGMRLLNNEETRGTKGCGFKIRIQGFSAKYCKKK
jgi:hypothetical protein